MRYPALITLALAVALLGGVAQAQSAPVSIRATIDKVDGNKFNVTALDGSKSIVTLAGDARIATVSIAKITDIKPGSYIGTAAALQPNGTLKALEVHVFVPSMRGLGEGSRPWGGANNSMTNGTVGSLVVSNRRRLTVHYKGGQKIVVVPDDVPIVSMEPGTRAELMPGAHVNLTAVKGADGALTVEFVVVGKNGTVPPM